MIKWVAEVFAYTEIKNVGKIILIVKLAPAKKGRNFPRRLLETFGNQTPGYLV